MRGRLEEEKKKKKKMREKGRRERLRGEREKLFKYWNSNGRCCIVVW